MSHAALAARTPVLLAAATTLTALDLLRVAGTAAGSSAGAVTWTVFGLAAAALAGPAVYALGVRRALPATVAALALARLVVQVPACRTQPVIAVALALAVAALVLAVRRCAAHPRGPARAARAVALAVGVDVAWRLPLDLWDPVWRGGPLGWLVAAALAAALAALARATHRGPVPVATGGASGPELALLGPVLALYGAYLAAPGFVAAQAGISLTAAGLWIAAGTVLGVWSLSGPPTPPPWLAARWPRLPAPPAWARPPAWVAPAAVPAALAVAVLVVLALPGVAPLVAPGTLVALAALPPVVRTALGRRFATGQGALVDLAVAGAGCGLGYALLVLPGQLRLAPETWPVVGAIALGGAAWLAATGGAPAAPDRAGHPDPADRPDPAAAPDPARARLPGPFVPVVLATVLLAYPPLAGAARTAPDPLPTDTAGGTYRLLSWNVHAAVDADGDLVPDEVLDTIRDSGAHVVVLQEVPRGWPGVGGLDLASWLERRLDAAAVWAPAADARFGNLILTSLPVLDTTTARLPQGDDQADRSFAAATIRLTDGETTRVATTHLAGGTGDTAAATRGAQLDRLLAALREDPHPHTVLAGDFNAEPDSAVVDTVLEAGFASAQDEAGDPARVTHLDPRRRVDWIFGTEDVTFENFRLLDSDASDHLPLTTTVWLDR